MTQIELFSFEPNSRIDLETLKEYQFAFVVCQSFEYSVPKSHIYQPFQGNYIVTFPQQDKSQQCRPEFHLMYGGTVLVCEKELVENLMVSTPDASHLCSEVKLHRLSQESWQTILDTVEMFNHTCVINAHYRTRTVLLKFILNLLLDQTQDHLDFPQQSSHFRRTLALRFKRLVQDQIKQKISVNQFAKDLNLSYPKLYSICEEYFSQSPKTVVVKEKISAIKRELLTTNKPLYQIAEDFGYDDASNFSKFFIKYANMHPSEFRRQSDWMIEE